MSFSGGLPSGGTITLTKTVVVDNAFTCSYVAKIGDNTCACILPEIANIAPPLLYAAGLDRTICPAAQTQLGTAPITGYTYSWSPTSNLDNPNISNPNFTAPANTTGAPVTYTYYLTTTRLQGCESEDTVIITVRPQPVASTNPNPVTICSGTQTNINLTADVPGTTFAWTSAVVAGVTGNADGSGSTISQTLINTTNTQQIVTYIVTPTSPDGCIGSPLTVSVNIEPKPTVTFTPTAQTICTGGTTNIGLSSNVTGATFSWTATGLNSTTGSGTTIAQTLINGTTAAVNVVYTVTASAAGCTSNPFEVTVTVNPAPTGSASPASSTICSGANVNATFTSDIVGTTFAWTTPAVSGISGNTAGSGSSLSQTLTSTNTTPTTVTYEVTPTGPTSLGSCPGAPFNVTVVVNPTPQVTITNNDDSICSEEFTDIILN